MPTILWADIRNPYIWIVLFVTLAYGAIGFIDDYRKLVKKHNLGLTVKQKFTLQFLVAAAVGIAIASLPAIHNNYSTVLTFPFIKPELFKLNLHWLYVPFIMLVLVFASNAVNLTDGLDGLAIGSTLIVAVTYTVLTYAAPSSNYRGESEENRTIIQKVTKDNHEYAVISPESMRNALRGA